MSLHLLEKTMNKELKEKAISIKGKDYVQVSDRVIFFNETYPKGSIGTKLISQPGDAMVIIKAVVTPDVSIPNRIFTGYSQAKWGDGLVNKNAALENAETSAVGRALAMMGIGVIETIASVDEMNKAGVSNGASKPIYQTDEERMEFKDAKCTKCGSPMNISKSTGKPYCSALCWKNPAPQKEIKLEDVVEYDDLPF